jgi:hypothetical protein
MMRKVLKLLKRSLPLGLPAQDVAQALLNSLPGTDAPGQDLGGLVARLRDHPEGLEALVGDLLQQHATAERHTPKLLTTLMGGVPKAHYISLGTHCFTASLLNRWGLRGASGPFDWLFSSVPMIIHCLEDEFSTFLDRSLYEPVPEADRRDGPMSNRVHHSFYRNTFGVQHVFNHHDAHLDEPYAHFMRCVERFRSTMQSADLKVLVLARTRYSDSSADLFQLRDVLRQYGTPFRLLAFEVPPGSSQRQASPKLSTLQVEGELQQFVFEPCSPWEPLRFADLLDEHVLIRQVLIHAAMSLD